jgi:enoyl-CoA hydratase/carnithine racemase
VVGAAQEIVVSVEANGVATVTLDRPGKRNAVSLAMWRRLAEIFAELGGREDVRVVILTGAGGNFCAGADISEFSTVRADSRSGRIYEAATSGVHRGARLSEAHHRCDLGLWHGRRLRAGVGLRTARW